MQGAGAATRDAPVAGGKSSGKDKALSGYRLAIAGIAVVVALAVVAASLRMTEGAIDRAVAEREAADRYLAVELAVLRIMAMSSDSPVPARLYLGIEECFGKSVAIPFEGDEAGRRTLLACAQMELGPAARAGRARHGRKGPRTSLSDRPAQ